MAEYFLGIDLGTTSTKVGVFDAEGNRIALAQATCPVTRLRPGWAEQDPRSWWQSVRTCWETIREQGVHPDSIVAIGVSGHFTVTFLDDAGEPARAAITWQDARAVEEARRLAARYPAERTRELFGISVPFSPAMPAAKIRWVTRREPEVAETLRWVCHAKDYIALQLCGEVCSDLQSFVGVVHAWTGEYDEEYLADLGLRPSQLPRFTPPYRNAGYATKEAAAALGIRIGIPIMTGWVDAFCSMLATGVYRKAAGFDYAGTSEIVGVRAPDVPAAHPGLLSLPFDEESAVVYGLTNCGADALAWAREALGVASYEALLELASSVTPSPDLPLFLPYLDGERSPVWDESARGVWVGLHRSHGRAELAFSVMEGVAHAVAQLLALAERFSGTEVRELVVSGGGARSALWNQIRADVTGRPVQSVREIETGALGAAMLAAVGYGAFESMEEAAAAMTRLGERFEPRAEMQALYARRHAVYDSLYQETKELRP